MTVEIDGLRGLYQFVKELDAEAAKGMRTAGFEAAKIVADRARIETPARTGALRQTVRPIRKQYGAAVRAGGTPAVPYAKGVHFGYRTLNYKGNRFMFRAADATVEQAAALYLDAVQRIWNGVV